MTSRQRVNAALNLQEPDRIPLDLGGFPTTGMHVSSVYLLRQALGLDSPGTPVKVADCYQMLGEIEPDLIDALGVDVLPLRGTSTNFGFKNDEWKEWKLFDGTPVLVPGGFNTDPEPNGDLLLYPNADKTAPPSGKMPKGGWYFDLLVRQPPIDEDNLDVEDNLEEFTAISDAELEHFRSEAERLYFGTDKAVLANFGGTSIGNIARVPAPNLKYPKGIRDTEEWYISHTTRRDYLYELFDRQCEIALANIQRISEVVGDKVTAIFMSGTDFGTQLGLFASPKVYRDLYKPFHKEVNDWIHRHTAWKSMIHTDGAVKELMEDFIEAEFDIFNPIQWTAADMDPHELKEKFGDRICFWGGGVDTQKTLPFGTPEQVREEVAEHVRILGQGGGYVFNTVHNVQAQTPVENILALYEAVRDCRDYPLG